MIGKGSPQSTALGQLGSLFISDTTAHAGGQWGVLYCVTACTFSSLTTGTFADGTPVNAGPIAAITLQPGQTIFGYFTAVTLATGSVIMYNI